MYLFKKVIKWFKTTNTFYNTSHLQTLSRFIHIERIERKNSKHKCLIGYVGGSRYSHPGAAVEALCLPRNPKWGNRDGTDGSKAEYETHGLFGKWHSVREHHVPCAVCLVRSRSVVNVFPGTRKSIFIIKRLQNVLKIFFHYHISLGKTWFNLNVKLQVTSINQFLNKHVVPFQNW